MQVSPAGQSFIKREEALRLRPYDDGVGFQTIGWGHLLKKGELQGSSISKEKAQEWFDKDIEEVENAIYRLVTVDLNQNEFDALASWVFNLGEDKIKSSTLLKKLNRGEKVAVPNELKRWIYAGGKPSVGIDGKSGLLGRRTREGELFMKKDECDGKPTN